MENLLYDETGKPRQVSDIEDRKLRDYVEKIENALANSMAVDGINYAFIICHQLLSSVSGYIESALESNQSSPFTKLDNYCTAAYTAIKSFKDHLGSMSCSTSQQEARRKELQSQFDKALTQSLTQYAPTIAYLKKSPSYLNTGLPSCLGNKSIISNSTFGSKEIYW